MNLLRLISICVLSTLLAVGCQKSAEDHKPDPEEPPSSESADPAPDQSEENPEEQAPEKKESAPDTDVAAQQADGNSAAQTRIDGANTDGTEGHAAEPAGNPAMDGLAPAGLGSQPPLVVDEYPWVVIAGGVRADGEKSLEKAKEKVQEIHDAGFPEAAAVDGRQFELFACCFHSIVVGRFAERDAANELVARLKDADIDAYAKKGFEPRAPLPDVEEHCHKVTRDSDGTVLEPVVEAGKGTRLRVALCEKEVEVECEPDERNCYDEIDSTITVARYDAKGRERGVLELASWNDPFYEKLETEGVSTMRIADETLVLVHLEDENFWERALITVVPSEGDTGLVVRHLVHVPSKVDIDVQPDSIKVTKDGENVWSLASDGTISGSGIEKPEFQGLKSGLLTED